ncbi:putative cold-regulated protein [Helianthus debilis subsp. tardiflorus]
MDANRACNGYRWTNERHLIFLKSVEASFVRTMLGNGDGGLLLLDRRVPDSCDSTLDSKMVIGRKKRKRHFLGDYLDASASLGIDQRVRRIRPHFPQDDQVVPQMKHVKNDECDKN